MGRGATKKQQVARAIARKPKYPEWMLRGEWPDGLGPVLVPGHIDDVARMVYRGRQSAFLALVIHDQTGGQIWGALNRHSGDGFVSSVPGHFGVEVTEKIVDIDGCRSFQNWQKDLYSRAVPLSREDLREWQRDWQEPNQWMRPHSFREQYRLAETFARKLF